MTSSPCNTCTKCDLGGYVREIGGFVCIGADEAQMQGQRILVIGQNPGAQEAREGTPFIGPSGKLIRKLLADVCGPDGYILTNAVKCHSPQNAEPTAEQIVACRPYLVDEIVKYRPRVILALGNPAFKALTGRSGILARRGQPHSLRADILAALKMARIDEIPVVLPSVHPAYVLRYPKHQNLLSEDAGAAYRLLRLVTGRETLPSDAWIDATFEDLDPYTKWVYDIESTTADYRDPIFRPYLIGVADSDDGPVKMLTDDEDIAKFALAAATRPGAQVTFNGQSFDEPALRYWVKGPYKPVDDVLLLAYLADESMPSHSLDACAVRWLGVPPWKFEKGKSKAAKEEASLRWMLGPQSPEEWLDLKQYTARDVRYTQRLEPKLYEKITPAQRRLYHNLLIPAAHSLTLMEENGLYVIRENLDGARQSIESSIEAALAKVKSQALALGHDDFNPNSTHQVRKLLFETLGLKPKRLTPKGEPSTDEASLKLLALQDKAKPICEPMLDYREATKIKSATIDRFEKLIQPDGRLHPPYFLHRTETGRTSSWIQQIPHRPEIRRVIGAPEGMVLVSADLSQIELVLAAWLSRDPVMLATYRDGLNGGDLHSATCMALLRMQQGLPKDAPVFFDKKIHADQRRLAKGVNFSCLYGAVASTVQAYLFKTYGLQVTLQQAEVFRDEVFWNNYTGLAAYYDELIKRVMEEKVVRTPLGRVRRLDNIDAHDIELRAEAARQAINTPNQGTGSDIALAWLNMVVAGYDWIKPVLFVHDSNTFEVPEDRADEAAVKVTCALTDAVKWIEDTFEVSFDVPIKAETKILKEWA